MTFKTLLRTLTFAAPVALFGAVTSNAPLAGGICDAPADHPFKVVISVTNDGNGNPQIDFTNYTVAFAPNGGQAPSPTIFVCLDGQAYFDTTKDNIMWAYNPGDFSQSPRHNPSPQSQYIIHNTNRTPGMFQYTVRVQTQDFGEMLIDPRVQNGGGGTAN